eukprot:6194439-Pleurochrysis_carterae.AAC.3
MSDTRNSDAVPNQPSCDSSQLSHCAWLDDLLPWLPTSNASYAPLMERGYTLTSQERVVVSSYQQHAQAVYFSFYTPYTMDAPAPIMFTFSTAPAAAGLSGPTTRSTPAGAAPAAAAPTSAAPVSTIRALAAFEKDYFVLSPE